MRTLLLLLTLAAGAWGQGRGALPLPAAGNVTLPLEEYNRLTELAKKPPQKAGGPPAAYVVQSADLKVEAGAGTATAAIQLDGEVLAQGAVKVPLVSGMTVLDAQQKGRDLALQQEGGVHAAVLEGPGEFSITLNAGFPLTIEAGRASFNLPVPAAGTARLTLAIPGEHTNVNLSPGLITSRTSNGGRTTIEAILVPGRTATLWWATRENAAPAVARETRFLSDVKTLVSVSEPQTAMTALVDITVVQGEPQQFELEIPAGYEVAGASGASLESSDERAGVLVLKVRNASLRSHQVLIALEKANAAAKAGVPFVSVKQTQRETGEALLEGIGTLELAVAESGGLKRMDLKETNPVLQSLSHGSPRAAFRYHRQPPEAPALQLEWVRFPESGVLAAVCQRASATTLVTAEGRSLTEVKLIVQNQAQPFLKVGLPAGAILSAEVGGEKVKPLEGADGSRVPLLRPGFRPSGPYEVSFVFLHAGTPFAKKGGSDLALPKMDVPVALLRWEVFLPESYKVTGFAGDATAASLLPEVANTAARDGVPLTFVATGAILSTSALQPGEVAGTVVDPSGAAISGARVTVTPLGAAVPLTAVTNAAGAWKVTGVRSGQLRIRVEAAGFGTLLRQFSYNAESPAAYPLTLLVGSVTETVEVTRAGPNGAARRDAAPAPKAAPPPNPEEAAASENVINLQRRVAGVLPVRIDVPRAGTAFRFVRALVVDEETKVTFNYRGK